MDYAVKLDYEYMYLEGCGLGKKSILSDSPLQNVKYIIIYHYCGFY